MFVKGKNKAWAALFVPPPILPGPEAILITDCECTRARCSLDGMVEAAILALTIRVC